MYQSVLIEQLLKEWIEWSIDPKGGSPGHSEFIWIIENEPEKGWVAILAATKDEKLHPHLGVMAAGPLEDLIALHGEDFIDRIEVEAKVNPKFAWMLGGVWQSNIDENLWARVQQVCDNSGW